MSLRALLDIQEEMRHCGGNPRKCIVRRILGKTRSARTQNYRVVDSSR